MASPVIIDDGGSTRIKWLNGSWGDMRALLDVDETANPPQSGTHTINESYSSLKILYLDNQGNPQPAAPITQGLNPGDTVVVTADNKQQISFAVAAASAGITVLGVANAFP